MPNTENQNTKNQNTESQDTENPDTEIRARKTGRRENSMQDGNKAGKQNQKGSRLKVILIAVVIIILLLQQEDFWDYLRAIEGKRKKGNT